MERVGEWRLIEPEEPETKAAPATGKSAGGSDLRVIAACVAALVLGVAGVAIWLTQPTGGVTLEADGAVVLPTGRLPGLVDASTPEPQIIVDVEGAVLEPGVHSLAAGSRVADAIAAAGGYNTQVDIAAAAVALNLAERVQDGQKIHVPARGEQLILPAAAASPPPGSGGLIDINHASTTELESLPGIGPVTAGKIIAAREVQPFASIDELDTRDVVGPSTLEKIRDLITITP